LFLKTLGSLLIILKKVFKQFGAKLAGGERERESESERERTSKKFHC
jgi:hypothetical protein